MTPDESENIDDNGHNTPLRAEVRRMLMNTPGSQSQSSQPLVFATPRTPGGAGTPGSTMSQRTGTPVGTMPRGDVGRGFRVPIVLNAPPTPETPMSWSQSPSGSMPPSPFGSHSSQQSSFGSQAQGGVEGVGPDVDGDIGVNSDAVLWGTTVNVQTCMNVFRNFLEGFTLPSEFEAFYQRQLHIIHRTQQTVLNLNCSHLREYAPTRRFYQQLKLYPQEIIPIMDLVVNSEYERAYGEPEGQRKLQVRTFGLSESSRMRDLDPENIDQLLCIKGMVVRCSPVIPDLKQAFFRCFLCNASVDVLIDRGRIDEPSSCQRCGGKGSMEMVHNRCLFTDKQLIRVQETPDEVPEGETPHTVSLFAFDDLVDTVRPGDRIEVTGIYRALPRRVTAHMRTLKAIYRTYIDAIHFRRANQCNEGMHLFDGPLSSNAEGESSDETSSNKHHFTASRVQEFKDFAAQGNTYVRLVESFAPSIWEMDDVKKGILCQLFGGTMQQSTASSATSGENAASGDVDPDDFNMSGESAQIENIGNGNGADEGTRTAGASKGYKPPHQRSDINILLCGDPGTSKSQLLSYVHKITPRGIYTSGKGSSAVGLTASVIRDPETRDMVLESGALVLSDNGICCIDEFDKMSDTTRAILHEAMEQQTVSITKAGIIATLNARTSILASANPVDSRYNPHKSVVENIKLPPTLLSRFDLIYLVLDKPNADSDRRLAKHLVSLYYPEGAGPDQRSTLLSQEFLKDYIYYCRYYVSPEITEGAVTALIEGYLGMRALGGRGSKTITATPRQLESMIRLSQALAKMRMSYEVTAEDVEESIRLMKVATQAAATDPRTGTIDMDMITTGRTAVDRDLILKLADQMQVMFSSRAGQRLTVGQIRQIMTRDSDVGIRMEDIVEAVRELEAGGTTPIQYTEATQTVLIRSTATHFFHN